MRSYPVQTTVVQTRVPHPYKLSLYLTKLGAAFRTPGAKPRMGRLIRY